MKSPSETQQFVPVYIFLFYIRYSDTFDPEKKASFKGFDSLGHVMCVCIMQMVSWHLPFTRQVEEKSNNTKFHVNHFTCRWSFSALKTLMCIISLSPQLNQKQQKFFSVELVQYHVVCFLQLIQKLTVLSLENLYQQKVYSKPTDLLLFLQKNPVEFLFL